MIKVVEKLPSDFETDRRRKIIADFEEIVKNRIRYCEIVDSGYSMTSLRDVGIKAACAVSRRHSGRRDWNRGMDAFTFHYRTKDDKRKGFFVEFDADAWDKSMAEAKKASERFYKEAGE